MTQPSIDVSACVKNEKNIALLVETLAEIQAVSILLVIISHEIKLDSSDCVQQQCESI